MSGCAGKTGCEKKLCEAKEAKHAYLVTGRPIRILHADNEVEYQKMSLRDLDAYILALEEECGCGGRRANFRFMG